MTRLAVNDYKQPNFMNKLINIILSAIFTMLAVPNVDLVHLLPATADTIQRLL
jgi:hypothetical protein